jgi:hypothetical protein
MGLHCSSRWPSAAMSCQVTLACMAVKRATISHSQKRFESPCHVRTGRKDGCNDRIWGWGI